MDTILAAIEPHLINLISATLAALIAWVALKVRALAGIQIEARHREALHSALMSGVRAALKSDGRHLSFDPAAGVEAVTDAAIAYARQAVPDALRHFGLDPDNPILRRLVLAKIEEALDRAGGR